MEINQDENTGTIDNKIFNRYDAKKIQENWAEYIKQCHANSIPVIRYDMLELKAINIIADHTDGFMQAYGGYIPNDDAEMYHTMTEECSYILTKKLLDKEISPVEYNFIRNELSRLLYDIFFISPDDSLKNR